jgi:YfiH family protein
MIYYDFFGKNCRLEKNLQNKQPFVTKLQELGIVYQEICFLNQTHSNEVVIIDSMQSLFHIYQNTLPQADAIISNQKNIVLSIITADCVPILLFDSKKQIISAVHAGHKGAKNNILSQVLEKMQMLGAEINNISAIIGPCIRKNSYQVSPDFYDNFSTEKIIKESFFAIDPLNSAKFIFDLPGYIIHQLTTFGIKNISDTKIDTYLNSHLYSSYRRCTHLNIKDCGRNISFIINH